MRFENDGHKWELSGSEKSLKRKKILKTLAVAICLATLKSNLFQLGAQLGKPDALLR